jgi:hypothetical protein
MELNLHPRYCYPGTWSDVYTHRAHTRYDRAPSCRHQGNRLYPGYLREGEVCRPCLIDGPYKVRGERCPTDLLSDEVMSYGGINEWLKAKASF